MSLYHCSFKMSFSKFVCCFGALLLLNYSVIAEDFTGRPGEDVTHNWIDLNVTNGVPDACGVEGRFNGSITRGAALHRLFAEFGIDTTGIAFVGNLPFYDVTPSYEYYSDIAFAYHSGIISGANNSQSFNPDCYVVRVEFVKMVLQTVGISLDRSLYPQDPPFPDMESSAWYYDYIRAAYNLGIIQGTDEDPARLMPSLALSMTEYDLIIQRTKACCNHIYSWNGNGSVINYSIKRGAKPLSVDGSSYSDGIGQDYAKIHSSSNNNPVVFFQWQLNSEKGKNLKIQSDIATPNASIIYGKWNGSKVIYKNVSLPFTVNPTKDNMYSHDGEWYVIAIAFDAKPYSDAEIKVTPTTVDETNPCDYQTLGTGCYSQMGASQQPKGNPFYGALNIDGFAWAGIGSLMTHGEKKGDDSITQDVIPMNGSMNKPTVAFFQWNRKNGKHLYLRTATKVNSTDDGCKYSSARITYGEWETRDNDQTTFHDLSNEKSYILGTLNVLRDGSPLPTWVLVKIEIPSYLGCHIYAEASD